MLKQFLFAGLGGFIGTCARYGVGLVVKRWCASPFPLGTFTVNIVGCFLIGLLYGWVAKSTQPVPQALTLLLITGFCGGFTTFSTFSDDFYLLLVQRQGVLSVLYPVLSLGLGLAMVALGRWCISHG